MRDSKAQIDSAAGSEYYSCVMTTRRRDKWKFRLIYGAPFGTQYQVLNRNIRSTAIRFVPAARRPLFPGATKCERLQAVMEKPST